MENLKNVELQTNFETKNLARLLCTEIGFSWKILLMILKVFGDEEATRRTVTLDVYYESLCPDSIRWFKKQLLPSYDALKDHLALTFVPYGKASVSRNLYWNIFPQKL